MKITNRVVLILIGATLISGFFYVYSLYNPVESNLFPKCPSKYVTGYDCPGCGSQRAVHSLFNGEVSKAFNYNPLLFFLVPYGLLVGVFEWIPSLRNHSFRKLLINFYTIMVVFSIVILFTVWRNL
ncbi:uncharacterized protein DUF2752 [Nonlabens dokdonensis]|uniref:Uncharacterized protein DUF2752 n=2 Tax=Nonlabens dokdonensis TaxID=328515 RepID=A0ABX5PZH1_9FLAO|nr:DUF2752 domain-containing protein [Nonlabens dokdonensis]AGC75496.1 putative membrane protein [Nonlabens dokdonensis DSW-6]PZX43192.1 uncharacterized protein DUF2752 [Nonlabens dokdonensis]